MGAGRRPLGWGTSGDAASSGFFFRLAGKGEFRGWATQPQRALSALFAAGSRLSAPPGASLCAFAEL